MFATSFHCVITPLRHLARSVVWGTEYTDTGQDVYTNCPVDKYGVDTGQTNETSSTVWGVGTDNYGSVTGQTDETSCTSCGVENLSTGWEHQLIVVSPLLELVRRSPP